MTKKQLEDKIELIADELLKKWVEHCGYYDEYDDECWTDSEDREYNKEYTTLMKDTIEYVENLTKKEK